MIVDTDIAEKYKLTIKEMEKIEVFFLTYMMELAPMKSKLPYYQFRWDAMGNILLQTYKDIFYPKESMTKKFKDNILKKMRQLETSVGL